MGKRYSVASHGIAPSDRLLLSSFLDLVVLKDGTLFALDESDQAPIAFVNTANAVAATWMSRQKPGQILIRFGHADRDVVNSATLRAPLFLDSPIRLMALRELLAQAVEQVGRAVPSQVEQTPAALPMPAHRRLEDLVGLLRDAENQTEPSEIWGINGTRIACFPQRKQIAIHCIAPDWRAAIAKNTHKLKLKPLEKVSPDANRETILSFAQVRWHIALLLSNGLLLPGLSQRSGFALTAWPDFGQFANEPNHMQMSALLVLRPVSISQLMMSVRVNRAQVIAFINACALIGLLQSLPADLLSAGETPIPARPFAAPANLQRGAQVARSAENRTTHPAPVVAVAAPKSAFVGFLGKIRSALGLSAKEAQ